MTGRGCGMVLFCFLVLSASGIRAQYIEEVFEYVPAPGQFINTAWGSPASASSITGGIDGSLSLGAFGGYVVFGFGTPVENHPDNPYGVDFTIFGNPTEVWQEPGIVSVMNDENGNGKPDDTWYELAGSDRFFSSTVTDYRVTYFNPGGTVAADVPWSDNRGGSGSVPANAFHDQPYYPLADSFPAIDPGSYTLTGTAIEFVVDTIRSSVLRSTVRAFGYADNRARGVPPCTLPDNPYTGELENAGGDAFDIGWAVDEEGSYVDLDRVHFIKVHTAVMGEGGWLGEVSTEIAGAADVAPDATISGIPDRIVIRDLPDTIAGDRYQIEAFAFHRGRRLKDAPIRWASDLEGAEVDAGNLLTFSGSGKVELTAWLAGKPEVTASVSTVLVFRGTTAGDAGDRRPAIALYPNPASGYFCIEGISNAAVSVYTASGSKVMEIAGYSDKRPIPTGGLRRGLYVIRIRESKRAMATRLFIN